MKKDNYIIRITTIDNVYSDYWVTAYNIWSAKRKAKSAFFRDFPYADRNIKLSLVNPDTKKIREIFDIIKEEN